MILNEQIFDIEFFIDKLNKVNFDDLLARANKIINDKIDIFDLEDIDISEGINFNFDYKNNNSIKEEILSLDNLDEEDNFKYIWELNKLSFLVVLCLIFRFTNNEIYSIKFNEFISSWIIQNSENKGVNWLKPINVAIRLLNLCICWQFIGENLEEQFLGEFKNLIDDHMKFLKNNSQTCDKNVVAACLYSSAVMSRDLLNNKEIEKNAKIYLENNLLKELHKDYVNNIRSVRYQELMVEALLIAGLSGETIGDYYSDQFWEHLKQMLIFLISINNVNSNLPDFGHFTNGTMLNINNNKIDNHISIFNSFNKVLLSNIIINEINHDYKTLLFYAFKKIREFKLNVSNVDRKMSFAYSGIFILGDNIGNISEELLIFNCGSPQGFNEKYGHRDMLSFIFTAGGMPVLIDCGSFSDNINNNFNNFLSSSSAHNSVQVSENKLNSKYQKIICTLNRYRFNEYVEGKHNAFENNENSVNYSRRISFDRRTTSWRIIDDFEALTQFEVEILFHVNPKCEILSADKGIEILFENGSLKMEFEEFLNIEIINGIKEPILGWHSNKFNTLEPLNTVRLSGKIQNSKKINTNFKVIFNEPSEI